jgi:hypothetical protein
MRTFAFSLIEDISMQMQKFLATNKQSHFSLEIFKIYILCKNLSGGKTP